MGIDVGTWASVASLIVSILALFPRDRRKRTEKQQQALLAVSEAYHETAAYLESRASHGRDRDREWDIALKWHDAAWLLMRYDAELSRRIGMKSEFWREGGIWDPKAIKDANIGLTTIWREVKALLGSGEDSPQDDRAESDMIRFLCPNCGKKCKAPAEAAGRRARCVRCGIRLEVPTSENPLVPPEQTVAVCCPFCGRLIQLPAEELSLPSIECIRCDTRFRPADHIAQEGTFSKWVDKAVNSADTLRREVWRRFRQ